MANTDNMNDAFETQGNAWNDTQATGSYAPAPAYPEPEAPALDLPEIDDGEDSAFLSTEARDFDISKSAGKDEGDDINQTLDEVSKSFGALKDSIEQGRELKAREREYDALIEQIEADREELADRDNILANYMAMANDQDTQINAASQQREQLRAEINDATARMQQAQQTLDEMRASHAQQIAPIESELGRATVTADQAKNDERSRKSELSAAESEVKKAPEDMVNIAQAKLSQITIAYNEAKARTETAKDQLKEAQKLYDNTRKQFDTEEAPYEKAIAEFNDRIASLKTEVGELEASLDRLTERRQYIEEVYRNPGDTEELRADIVESEATERQMSEENEELRYRLADSKERSKKAKITIGIVIAVVIIIIALVIYFTMK